ncbi:MAG: flagellar filament capping protein FliD, partial [Synergistaceae bacterium]|nr:flagellar filament capping protein FliD [Synergistaceae bacterium]
AVLVVDGSVFTRSSNLIGESYNNEIIKGVTLDVKGSGKVELDVFLNAETAITAIQDFLTAYNDVLGWINTRMTEKEVDTSIKATLDSDDFRMKWGLLNGNSLLRGSKNTLRRLTSQVYTPPFTQRTSRGSVWGTNSLGHLIPIVTAPAYQPPSETFSITADGRTLIAKVDPGQTLADVVANINNPNWNPTVDSNPATAKNPLFYDENGVLYGVPLARAKVGPNNTLVVETMDSAKPVTLGGSTSILSALQINFAYTTLSQVGIKLPSYGAATEEAKIGTLEFDTNTFMTAIENNPQDLAALMTTFAGQMDTYMNDMLRASQKEVAPGITTTQGAVVREMEAIDQEIQRIDKYLAEFDRRLEMKRSSLFDRFSKAETNLAKLMEQANWLAGVTSQLQSAGK